MTKAKAGLSRHGPSSPKPGMRTITMSGRMARTASTSKPELLEHPRRVVLDEHVAGREQPAQQVPPRVGGEVEGDALLVGVEAGEDPRLLPPVRLGEAQAGEHAGAVGPGGRLDVDHLGAEHRQHVGAERPGPEGGEVEHAQPVEGPRPPARLDRRRRPAGVVRPPGAAPERGAAEVEPVRAVGLGDAVARVRDDRAAGLEVVGLGDGRAVADRRVRDAEGAGQVEDLGGGALGHPRRDVGREVGPVGEELAVLHPLGVLDHHAEVEPLLAGADARGRPGRRWSPRRRASRSTARCGTAGPTMSRKRHRVVGEAQRQRLEHRDVDELAAPPRSARDAIVPMAA